jgi:hypothetical protein
MPMNIILLLKYSSYISQRMGRDIELLPTHIKEESSPPNKLKGILTSLFKKPHGAQVCDLDGWMPCWVTAAIY